MNKTKKLLSGFLTLFLALSTTVVLLLTVSATSPTATCTVNMSEHNVGTDDYYISADVTFTSETEFTAGLFAIEAENLTLTDCTIKDCTGGEAPETDSNHGTNMVLFTGFSNSNVDDFRSYTSVTLALDFAVNPNVQTTSYKVIVKDISISDVEEVKFVTQDAEGTLNIEQHSDHTPGDINGDNSVNNKDLTRLFQYLSDWDVTVNEAALDVNGDGSVNNKDLTRLFQYLSDWDVEIF